MKTDIKENNMEANTEKLSDREYHESVIAKIKAKEEEMEIERLSCNLHMNRLTAMIKEWLEKEPEFSSENWCMSIKEIAEYFDWYAPFENELIDSYKKMKFITGRKNKEGFDTISFYIGEEPRLLLTRGDKDTNTGILIEFRYNNKNLENTTPPYSTTYRNYILIPYLAVEKYDGQLTDMLKAFWEMCIDIYRRNK